MGFGQSLRSANSGPGLIVRVDSWLLKPKKRGPRSGKTPTSTFQSEPWVHSEAHQSASVQR